MDDEMLGCVLQLLFWAFIAFVVIALIYYAALALAFAGGVYGGIVSIGNYSKSFNENIGRKRIWKSNRQN